MKLKILVVVFCVIGLNLYAQSSLNQYKYIIVPKKFDFQKVEDKYQLNSLTKFLFNKEGFETLFIGDDLPQDLFDNPCLGLKVNAMNKSGMLSTKMVIELLDCRDTVIFTSIEGKSKEKEYKRGYQEAVRRAFESVKALDYKYDATLAASLPSKIKTPTVQVTDNESKITPKVEIQPTIEAVKSDEKQVEIVEELVEEDKATNEEIEFNDATEVTKTVDNDTVILYAQDKPFGFQLVDSAPRVVYLLQKTSIKDMFILKNKNGIIYKKNEKWVAEYYENDQLIQKDLTIKF